MKKMLLRIKKWPNSLKIILASLISIASGGLMLSLPISHTAAQTGTVFDHFFTSASLVSINSMTSVEFSETYSYFGKGIAIFLMRIGGQDEEEDFLLEINADAEIKKEKRFLGIAKRDDFDRLAGETALGYDLRLDD